MQFIEGIRGLSATELGMLGMADVAYIKPVVVDGTEMAVIGDRQLAFAVVRQH